MAEVFEVGQQRMKRRDEKPGPTGKSNEPKKRRARMDRHFRTYVFIILVLVESLGAVAYWALQERTLERNFQQQYGPDWQDEFQRYHGTEKHLHNQIGVSALALLILIGLFSWLGWRAYQLRARERFTYHSV